ncbi:hypothetical protein A6F49_00805 [Enteractinococcus helveticum]|uniref:Uncharacterized protein n=2 Tax=Enteractinococcus helveticum TaxID=1837282 RepID=A0A1B7LVJ6_9MICC|nr:hypothetical protein A6F49_00805 [Enteractinococcus helveticum]
MAGLDLTWDERLAQPAADLAIIGTESWLKQELEANLGIQNDDKPPSSIRSILMPEEANSATWYTRFFPAASFMDKLPLPTEVNATVLDGNGAAAYLTEIEVPVVICVLDRSIADEATAETIVQLRNTRGEPVSLANDLQWSPPTGVEALGFTVAL